MSLDFDGPQIDVPLLCPSARCSEGAQLLGIVLQNGSIAFAPNQIFIDRGFVQVALRGRAPEKRFRFANRCLQNACGQWNTDRCGVADRLVDELIPVGNAPGLPGCGIRQSCRWFHQRGEAACRICPEIVTDGS